MLTPEQFAAVQALTEREDIEPATRAAIATMITDMDAFAEALTFYADPRTYFAVALLPDSPAGPIMEDFSDTWLNCKPGHVARTVLDEHYGWRWAENEYDIDLPMVHRILDENVKRQRATVAQSAPPVTKPQS